MLRTRWISIMLLVLAAIGLAGCNALPGQTPAPTLVAPTVLPAATVTREPSPVVTVAPTAAPTVPATAAPATSTPVPVVSVPTRTPLPTPHGDGACSYRVAFLGDVTIPDNTVVPTGAGFVKTWRVRNDGTCTWGSAGYALHSLVFTGGDRLGAPASVELPPEVRQGVVVDLAVPMTAPASAGTYRSEWMLQVDNGPRVGVGAGGSTALYAQIVASAPVTVPGAERIIFAPGATNGTAQGTLAIGQSKEFVVSALRGQTMMLTLSSAGGVASLSVRGAQGIPPTVLRTSSGYWLGTLPITQDYVIRVNAAGNFSLNVTIPQRITFEPGGIGAAVTGATNSRRTVTYLLRAARGQTMTVVVNAPPNTVGLTIYGLDDGNPLVRAVSGATSWTGQLPGTQDYVIEVVPVVDAPVNFSVQTTVR